MTGDRGGVVRGGNRVCGMAPHGAEKLSALTTLQRSTGIWPDTSWSSIRVADRRRPRSRRRRAPGRDRRPYRPLAPRTSSSSATQRTEKTVWWDNNGALTPEQFELLLDDFIAHAEGKELFAQDLYGGADPNYRIKARVFTELAWHSLFIRTC